MRVYIYPLKRRPDANECILHGENTNAQKERESVGEITPFLCESSSLNVRHTFDTFSRENVRERHEFRTQSCAEKQSAQKTRLKTKSRLLSRQLEVALQRARYKMSTPQFRVGNPLAPEKGAFPLDHFGECATFKETYLKCLQKQKSDANKCTMESKSYLECRMAKELMAKQPLSELGFTEEDPKEETNANRGRKEEKKRSTEKEEEENERNGFVAGARRARQQQKEFAEAARRRRSEGRD
ncbi:unnamed protein product [Bathycoccus prasinos]